MPLKVFMPHVLVLSGRRLSSAQLGCGSLKTAIQPILSGLTTGHVWPSISNTKVSLSLSTCTSKLVKCGIPGLECHISSPQTIDRSPKFGYHSPRTQGATSTEVHLAPQHLRRIRLA